MENKFDTDDEQFTSREKQRIKDLLAEFEDIFQSRGE